MNSSDDSRGGLERSVASTEDVQKFWRHVFGGKKGLLQIWTAERGPDGKIDGGTIVDQYFSYPKSAKAAAEWALGKSEEGRDVYFCAHLLNGDRRVKENAAAVLSLWGEVDGVEVPDGVLKPTAVIESSPGRYHLYWRLEGPITPQAAEELNKRLANKIEADPSGFDLTQLLRVPGTRNHKPEYEGTPLVQIQELDAGRSFSVADLDKLLPELEDKRNNGYQPDAWRYEPPVVLDMRDYKVWKGEFPVIRDGGVEVDRSASLLKIGGVLYDRGVNRSVIVEALEERDKALGWRKYSDRKDAQKQYHKIVDKLKSKGRIVLGPPKPALAPDDEVNRKFKKLVDGGGRRSGSMPFNTTDLGNAERLRSLHGKNLHYVHAWGKWLEYDGARWRVDDTGAVGRRAKETTRSIYGEAEKPEYAELRKELAQHAIRSETRSRIEAMVVLAQSEPDIPVRPDKLDADPWLLNVENGTIDLRTGELREHQREDLITKHAPVEYDPDAEAPTWEAFLERVLPSEELRGFVQRAVGYSLTGDTRERVLLILHGMGRNGKSTFLEAIREALGAEDGYAMKTPAETLMAKPAGGIPNDVARLKGARFVSASETEKDRRLAEALVKEITGNDTISARFMRAEWFDFRPTHKVWLATNHRPEIRGTDPAIWDRIRLVPFDVRIPDDEIDRELPEKLKEELSGILAWAVRGCLEWQYQGLGDPEEVRNATADYRSEMDVLAAFIEDCCVVHPNAEVTSANLYESYQDWCEKNGERAEKKRSFGRQLNDRGFEKDRGTGGVHIRRGVGLRSALEPDPDGSSDPSSGKGHSEKSPQKCPVPGVGDDTSDLSDLESGMNNENHSHEAVNPEKRSLGSLRSPGSGGDPPVEDDRMLPSEEIAAELGLAGSGPARSLANYLEKPNEQRLEYVVRAVLLALGERMERWERYREAVREAALDPQNHPLDCECEGCL